MNLQEILQACDQLGEKIELHINFIIQTTMNGNNLAGLDIDYTSIGHTTHGDNCDIAGNIDSDIR